MTTKLPALAVLLGLFALTIGITTPTASFAAEGEVLYSGSFKGRSAHKVSGGVTVVEQDGRKLVILDEAFRFDGAPDPKLGFSRDGRKPKVLFSPLRSDRGRQVYELPGRLNTEDLAGLNLWCERFGVQLGYVAFR
ncbi:MAG: DM13 domain-containing protein [Pseudomonadota bacterium]